MLSCELLSFRQQSAAELAILQCWADCEHAQVPRIVFSRNKEDSAEDTSILRIAMNKQMGARRGSFFSQERIIGPGAFQNSDFLIPTLDGVVGTASISSVHELDDFGVVGLGCMFEQHQLYSASRGSCSRRRFQVF